MMIGQSQLEASGSTYQALSSTGLTFTSAARAMIEEPTSAKQRASRSLLNEDAKTITIGDETVRIRNAKLAGDEHPKTGVPYDQNGFPIFEAKATIKLDSKLWLADEKLQFKAANKQLYEMAQNDPNVKAKFAEKDLQLMAAGDNPVRYTWHHNQDLGVMQLVETSVHAQSGHTGGAALWRIQIMAMYDVLLRYALERASGGGSK